MAGHLNLLVDLAPNRGLPSRYLSISLVVFYTTVAPEPTSRLFTFLWHYPHGRPHRTLSGDLPWGARTFLISCFLSGYAIIRLLLFIKTLLHILMNYQISLLRFVFFMYSSKLLSRLTF